MKNKITLNTDERIFLIDYLFDMGRQDMCNLEHLESLIKNSNGVKKISHFWGGKFVKISKKDLKEMLQANQMRYDFI